jgi:hypothetical protein
VRFHSVFSKKSAVAPLEVSPGPEALLPPCAPGLLPGAVTLLSMALREERLLVCRDQVT